MTDTRLPLMNMSMKSRVIYFKEVLYMADVIVENAKVMSKGQITLPKDIREALKLGVGDRVTLIYEHDQVVLMNPAVYAMQALQNGMRGEAEKAGLTDEDDIMALVNNVRTEIEGL